METNLVYLVKGELVSIPKEVGERSVRYFMRVKFITERLLDIYEYDKLIEYSCVLADSSLFGVDYPKRITDQLKRMLIFKPLEVELSQVAEDILNGELYEEPIGLGVRGINLNNILLSDKASLVATDHFKVDTNASSGLELEKFEEIAHTGDLKELVDPIIEKVEYQLPQGDSQQAGIALTIIDAVGTELVVQACGDQVCQNGGDVIFSNPAVEEAVVIQAVPVDVLNDTQEVKQDIFQSVSDRNGFMMPEYANILKCYARALNPEVDEQSDVTQLKLVVEGLDQDEDKMRACILETFTNDESMQNKLRATRHKELVYAPTSESNWDIYWSDENRYGKLLMQVRSELTKPKTKTLQEVVNEYIANPIDIDRMTELHEQIDAELGQSDLFSDVLFTELLKLYSSKMFDNVLTLEDVKYEIKWSDVLQAPGSLDIADVISMELSRPIFQSLEDREYLVFGVPCKTKLQCIQVFIESFIAGVLFETLEMPDNVTCESLAESLFTHSDGEVSFAKSSEPEMVPACELPVRVAEAPKKTSIEVRNEILGMLNETQKVRVTIPEGEFDVSSARSLTEVMLVIPDGSIPRKQAYEKITHINGNLI